MRFKKAVGSVEKRDFQCSPPRLGVPLLEKRGKPSTCGPSSILQRPVENFASGLPQNPFFCASIRRPRVRNSFCRPKIEGVHDGVDLILGCHGSDFGGTGKGFPSSWFAVFSHARLCRSLA